VSVTPAIASSETRLLDARAMNAGSTLGVAVSAPAIGAAICSMKLTSGVGSHSFHGRNGSAMRVVARSTIASTTQLNSVPK
jgi:hypothetical protein